MKSRISIVCTLSAAFLIYARAAESAPSELYGKTVILSWSEHRVQKTQAGDIKKGTTSSQFRVYISTAGRLFSTFERRNAATGRSNKSDQGPDGGTTVSGVGQGSRSTRFEGGQLLSENAMRSGARRIQAAFDSNYRNCTLQVLYGKQAGAPLYHRAMDGRMYTIISTEVISPTCSISDGNLVSRE
jgi:hypothetical protein